MKKKFLPILILTTLLSVGCGPSQKGSDDPPKPKIKITLSQENLKMEQFSTASLIATTENTESSVTWSVSDEDFIKITPSDNICDIEALKVGNCTIYATIDEVVASCKVKVEPVSGVPVLEVSENDIIIGVDYTFDIDVRIRIKDRYFDCDFKATYEKDALEDIASFEMDGGILHITGEKAGNTSIVVGTIYNQIQYAKRIKVTVVDGSVNIVLDNVTKINGRYTIELGLETIDTFVSSFTVDSSIYINDQYHEELMPTFLAIDNTIVNVNNNVISALKVGTTIVNVSYSNFLLEIDVNVVRPEIIVETPIDVEVINPIIYLDNDVNVVGAYIDSSETNYLYSCSNKIVTLNKNLLPKTASLLGEGKSLKLVTENSVINYIMNLYTQVIKTKEQLLNWTKVAKQQTNKDNQWDGYFVLGNDIDITGEVYQGDICYATLEKTYKGISWNDGRENGFTGIFDGRGHVIDGLFNQGVASGFIGVLHINGILRNVSFINAINSGWSGLIVDSGDGTIADVFVQCLSLGEATLVDKCGVIYGKDCMGASRVRHVIVDLQQCGDDENYTYFGTYHSGYEIYNGAYCIGKTKAKAFTLLSDIGGGGDIFDGFETYKSFANAGINFSGWDQNFWDCIGGFAFPRSLEDIRPVIN